MIICDLCKSIVLIERIEVDTIYYELCKKCIHKLNDFLEGKAEIITKEEHATWLKSISKE